MIPPTCEQKELHKTNPTVGQKFARELAIIAIIMIASFVIGFEMHIQSKALNVIENAQSNIEANQP